MDTYKTLFKTDELVASLFHNFFLAQVGVERCYDVARDELL